MAGTDNTTSAKRSLLKNLDSFPELSFSPERAEILFALIRHQESEFKNRSRYRRVLSGKGDKQRARDAACEAKEIKKAAIYLGNLIDRLDPTKIDWGNALRGHCVMSSLNHAVLGANLPDAEWRTEMAHLLSCFADLAKARQHYYTDKPTDLEADYPSDSTQRFATALAYIYVAAGGKFGQKTGKVGFPKFLMNVHPLVPLSYGSINDASFARQLGDSISEDTMTDLEQCEEQPYRADYMADLLTANFRHRPL